MPTSLPSSSTTGSRRTWCCAISRSASSRSCCGSMVTRSLAAISVTLVDCGSLPSAATLIAMSRSVTTPTRRSPSVIGMIPASSSRISRAASATVESAVTDRGFDVITSLICPIASPLLAGHRLCPRGRFDANDRPAPAAGRRERRPAPRGGRPTDGAARGRADDLRRRVRRRRAGGLRVRLPPAAPPRRADDALRLRARRRRRLPAPGPRDPAAAGAVRAGGRGGGLRAHRAGQRCGERHLREARRRAQRGGDVGLPVRGVMTVVRPATDDDADMLVAWFADPETSKYWDGETFTREQMLHRLRRRTVDAWIVESNGRPVGYLQSWWEDDLPKQGGLDGFLIPAARGLGLMPDAARALATSLVDEGWAQVTVDPYEWNERALKAWRTAGFVPEARHGPDEDHTAPWILMRFDPET